MASDRQSNLSYRLMLVLLAAADTFAPYVDQRVQTFGLRPDMTVVDYGCGPGRYATRFASLVGESGRVYAVDIHEIAIELVTKKVQRLGLHNLEPVLARGYTSGLPGGLADMVFAIDMFHGVHDPTAFLAELRRIAKPDAILIMDDGDQPRRVTREKVVASGCWEIIEETRDHLKCKVVLEGKL